MKQLDAERHAERPQCACDETAEGLCAATYSPPRLVRLGSVRDVTLGSPFGNGDSGGSTTEKPPGTL